MDTNYSISRLRELHGSGYEVADGEPDITGWTIKDGGDRKIGVVHDLLFDPEEQKVRYIIANLKNNDFDLERRKVLIPIGMAVLHEEHDDVIFNSVMPWQLRALPTYGDRVTDEDEQDILTIFSGVNTTTAAAGTYQPKPQNFYENPAYNYDNIFKRRSAKMNAKPGEHHFRKREGFVEPPVRDNDAEYDMRRKQVNEPEEMVVTSDSSYRDDDLRRNRDANERLLSKIRRMQDELDEIERDLKRLPDRGRI